MIGFFVRKIPCDNFIVIYDKEWREKEWPTRENKSEFPIDLRITINFHSEKIKFTSQHQVNKFSNFGSEVGGYVGMFLGYSLIQMPNLIIASEQRVIVVLSKIWQSSRNKCSH